MPIRLLRFFVVAYEGISKTWYYVGDGGGPCQEKNLPKKFWIKSKKRPMCQAGQIPQALNTKRSSSSIGLGSPPKHGFAVGTGEQRLKHRADELRRISHAMCLEKPRKDIGAPVVPVSGDSPGWSYIKVEPDETWLQMMLKANKATWQNAKKKRPKPGVFDRTW